MLDGAAWNLSSAHGDAILNIGHNGWADGDDSGTGRLTLRNGAAINFDTSGSTHSVLDVGGGAGSVAQLYVAGGSVVEMDVANLDDAVANLQIGYRGASNALVVIDGANSEIRHLDFVGIGFDATDSFSKPGGRGTLLLNDGAQITVGNVMVVGTGGIVGGWNGTINGGVVLTNGGKIDLRDGQFGTFDVNGRVFIENAGNQILGDIGANDGNVNTLDGDLIKFNGAFDSNAAGQFVVTVNAIDGFKFGVGETRVVAEVNGGNANRPTFTVTNQHADFAFYGGALPTNPGEIVIQALNSGLNGGIGTLDFGVAGPAAVLSYNATANNGFVSGGRLGSVGGSVTNVDQFLGTNFNDTLHITTPGNGSRAFTLFGRGGADNLLGGAANDRLYGEVGNDTLTGGTGNDTLSGGADNDRLYGGLGSDNLAGGVGADIFAFNTAPNASTNRDIVTDFAHGVDKIHLENAIFTKLGAGVHALSPLFFKAGVATDANDYILYNKASGVLSYDINGNGAGGAIAFAVLTNKPVLTAADFYVI